MQVFWNGYLITELTPANYKINKFRLDVFGKRGVNTLAFKGRGAGDRTGLTVDNVALRIAQFN